MNNECMNTQMMNAQPLGLRRFYHRLVRACKTVNRKVYAEKCCVFLGLVSQTQIKSKGRGSYCTFWMTRVLVSIRRGVVCVGLCSKADQSDQMESRPSVTIVMEEGSVLKSLAGFHSSTNFKGIF
ncbi:hypothetical protein MHYP_G00031260 [Metynnis hypsauchen]